MASTFTLTGTLYHQDNVTPVANTGLKIKAAPYPDPALSILYTRGISFVTDANGHFSQTLVTESGLYYTIRSTAKVPMFAPITFAAGSAGATLDLSTLTSYDPTGMVPNVYTDTIAARNAAQAAAAGVQTNNWAASTAYATGQIVRAPDGSTIRRKAAGTSSSTFSADQANWDTVLAYPGTMDNAALGPAVGITKIARGAGIDPTGATDSSAAIQALLDAMPSNGGRLHFPAVSPGGYYKIATGLTTSVANIEITGEGAQGQDTVVGNGSTRIHYTGTGWAFTFQPTPTSTIFRGPKFRDISITGTSSATGGGIRINRASNWVLRDVAVSDFTAGTAFLSDGTGDINQYGVLDNFTTGQVKNGVDLTMTNGLRMIGGTLQGMHGSIVAGSFGIRHTSGDTLRLYGTDVQGFAILSDLQAVNDELHGFRGEDWLTAGIRIGGTMCRIEGGSLNNTLNSAVGTPIVVQSTASRTVLRPQAIVTGNTGPYVTDASSDKTTALRYPEQTSYQRKTRGGTDLIIASTQTSFAPFDSTSAALFDLVFTGVMPGDWLEIGCGYQVSNEAVQLQVDAQTMVTLGTAVNSVGQQDSVTPRPTAGVMGWAAQGSVNQNVSGSVMYQVVAADIAANGTVTVRPVCKVTAATARTIFCNSNYPIIWWGRNHGKA